MGYYGLRAIDITGKKFNNLTTIKRVEDKNNCVMYLCKCDCGNETTIAKFQLTSNGTKSCGCLNHLGKHNMSDARIYKIWKGMRHRCKIGLSRSKYHGDKGIVVCDEWNKKDGFFSFYTWSIQNGYTDELTIDRINNNGNYEPSNCRWTISKVQGLNKGIQSNNKSGHKGIFWMKKINKWRASIHINNKDLILGYFENIDDAIKVRKEAELKYYKPILDNA